MTPRRHAGNLPAELSSFVGRRREVAEVAKLLQTARLVTLTGTGGVGKTRVATHAARQVRRGFPDGVWLAELAPLAEPALLAQTVAGALGVHHSTKSSATVLADHLADKRLLLVLDNCEHLLDACADLVHQLLGASAGLRVLATSRHLLGVPGEHLVDVPPLSLPEPDRPRLSADGHDAVRLFAERAAAVRAGFELTDDNYPAVAGICTILEGIPLAIEMAARRMHVLSAGEILSRLDDRFALLTTGGTVAAKRHQTLLATVGWSFDLCSPAEQLLWTRLSVFLCGFDLAAAEMVGAGGTIAPEQVVDLVAGLVQKSVLTRQADDTRTRYQMLDSVRDYGRTRLSHADEVELRGRHRDWYRQLANRFAKEWFGPHQPDWCARLRGEHANLRMALDFCLTEPGSRQAGLAMVTDLWSYWITYGSVGEGYRWLALALAAAPEPTPLRAKALWVRGWTAQISVDSTAAQAALDECRALAERLDDRTAMAHVVHFSGFSAMSAGEHTVALARYEDALARHRALGDEAGVTAVLFELAFCHCLRGDPDQGDLDRAVALCAESVRRSAVHGETWCRSYALHVRAMALWRQGGHDQDAERAVRESIRFKQALNDVPGIGMGLELLAWITAADGAHRRAARLTGAARQIWRAVGAPLGGIHQLLRYREHAERQMTAALGVEGFEAALQVGANLTVDEALSYDDLSTVPTAPSQHRPRPARSASRLTRREWQVADLVAQGMTNKDIAASLDVVQRTAEAHVQHILTKLGFTSRARLAAWVVEQRVEEPGAG
jgi:non-specific serine/threonine protein kinase